MNFYFLDEALRASASGMSKLREAPVMPIRVRKDTWEHFEDPDRLARIYRFDDPGQQRYFVSESLRAIDVMHHNVKITIESDSVQVETYTGDLNEVTELDLQIAREFDRIFDDAQFILEPL